MGIENDDRIDPKTRLLDLGIDSLMSVEIRFLIEKDFQKTLQNEEIINLTIQDILFIESKIEQISKYSK
jgi:acyl carrier protein